ncbi:hypothetical protein EHI8A_113810 [Entamoeba histolytica HM-1:IMSS-B]|uniref:TLDc domain-containing protein n=6 Tax=Entamoeba histolytica TaxID=5759 RepID=C4M076_ENTH1|nr:hypothetical protein EHI_004800 [Entamoeba histolytica HM-1:IMSS]EMD43708.1 Hypothetical protein EHI5A_147100 [Entamoeba histolytica KU27]EMH75478.1 hypothetical protein EHI8A_113810 [Entamoeba histolytica HM-1:IMSS-B]EMS16855.1 hypothetical protein KM1_184470 [Entamoeba histolytica HM-3:IMSS]ENY62471.1 hypothetical protein EHI7A_106680 [Entamoeba histolytica HM-1:IMSS-A]GAT94549.1 hypothetical protein CL6EHI_004800 [Entamoeba histolytica]|eukprot:XP_650710.1 hypothetical protein EHI_004800 [Entamoeba histolytica HM-1:IMSS]
MDRDKLLLMLLTEIKEMRNELNELRDYVHSNLPTGNIPRQNYSQSSNLSSNLNLQTIGENTLGLLPDVTVTPPMSPRKTLITKKVEPVKVHQLFENNMDFLQNVDGPAETPTQPRPENITNKQYESVIERVSQKINKTIKSCVYDSSFDEIKPSKFYEKTKLLNNVIICVETTNGIFGSFHSVMPKEIMQDMINGDEQLIIFEECLSDIQIYRPKLPKEAVCSFFGDSSKNLFGIFYGYWLKVNKTYIIDSMIYENYTNTINAFKTNSGEFKRISVWVCE